MKPVKPIRSLLETALFGLLCAALLVALCACSASAPDASETNPVEMTLIIENNRYTLTVDDAEKMRQILSLEDMTATEDDECFYPYVFVAEEAQYNVLQDLTKIQASVVSDDGEYSHYEKQTTQAEQATLKSVISN